MWAFLIWVPIISSSRGENQMEPAVRKERSSYDLLQVTMNVEKSKYFTQFFSQYVEAM